MAEPTSSTTNDRRLAAATLALFGAGLVAVRAGKRWLRDQRDDGKGDRSREFGSIVGRGTPSGGPTPSARKAGYETSDANVRTLAIVMASSVGIMIIGVTAVFLMFGHFGRGFQAANKVLTAQQRAPIVPPLPHLQANPYRDIDAVLMEQAQRLNSYGWNDPEHTSAHIPISRAMRQVVGRDLDATATSDAVGAPGTDQSFVPTPDFNALIQQHKPANRIQGEGRPGSVAPNENLGPSTQGSAP